MSINTMAALCMSVQVPKPKLEMVVPYKEYKLVRSDGSIPERTKKHPFCMSRVHYSATGQLPFQSCTRASRATYTDTTSVVNA